MHSIKTLGKAAAGATTAALLLTGANLAFAQTYANPDGTGSVIPSSNTNTGVTTGTTGSSSTTRTSGTTGTSGMSGSSSSTTPGIPNTGAGGDAAGTLAVLGVSAAAAVAAGIYLARSRTMMRV